MHKIVNGKRVDMTPAEASERRADEARQNAKYPLKVKADIKSVCKRRILRVAPEWKQRNLIRGALVLERAARNAGGEQNLTAKQKEEIRKLEAIAQWIDDTRAFSDALEASIDGMTLAELRAFNPDEQPWPAP